MVYSENVKCTVRSKGKATGEANTLRTRCKLSGGITQSEFWAMQWASVPSNQGLLGTECLRCPLYLVPTCFLPPFPPQFTKICSYQHLARLTHYHSLISAERTGVLPIPPFSTGYSQTASPCGSRGCLSPVPPPSTPPSVRQLQALPCSPPVSQSWASLSITMA